MKALVADDEKDIRRLICFSLERAGFEVIEAANGKQALDFAMQKLPEIILLDVMMPDMDGYEVCRKIRLEPNFGKTPVLILSAKGQAHEIEEGLRAGATDYIVKPFAPGEIVAKVKKLMGLE